MVVKVAYEDCDYQPRDGEKDTPNNLGYVGFFDFADEMAENGYEQIRCPKCDLWHIWVKVT